MQMKESLLLTLGTGYWGGGVKGMGKGEVRVWVRGRGGGMGKGWESRWGTHGGMRIVGKGPPPIP